MCYSKTKKNQIEVAQRCPEKRKRLNIERSSHSNINHQTIDDMGSEEGFPYKNSLASM